MKFKIQHHALIISVALLSACGGGSSIPGGGDNPVTNNTTINSFTVTGSGNAVAGKTPINAAINNGAFQVNWDIDSTDPYRAIMYLSADNTLDTNEATGDIELLGLNCGSISLLYECNKTAKIDCSFNSSNKIACGTAQDQLTYQPKDLTTFLDTIPKTAYLMVQACNLLMTSCKTSAVQIELQ